MQAHGIEGRVEVLEASPCCWMTILYISIVVRTVLLHLQVCCLVVISVLKKSILIVSKN
jgi:hypothetical protein